MAGHIGGTHGHFSTAAGGSYGGHTQVQGAGQGQGGAATAGGGGAGGQQPDTVQIGNLQVPTSFSNHGQEVSWAAHHGIHGTDLAQIAGGDETVQQYLQDQQKQQTQNNTAAGNGGVVPVLSNGKQPIAGAQPAANTGTGTSSLTDFLTNLMNEIKAFLAKQPATQTATQPATAVQKPAAT